MPSGARSVAGPTPERSRIAGLPYEPAGEDHLTRGDLSATRCDNAGRPAAVEENAVDEHIAGDLEVGAVADLLGEIHEPVFCRTPSTTLTG